MKLTTRVVVPRAASKQVGYADKEYQCDRCGKLILPNTKMKVTLPRVGYDGNTHSIVYRRHFGVTCESKKATELIVTIRVDTSGYKGLFS